MPLPLTVSCYSKIQIGFTFLVPAHPGSPGKRAVKRVCVCVCVCHLQADCWELGSARYPTLGITYGLRLPFYLYKGGEGAVCTAKGRGGGSCFLALMELDALGHGVWTVMSERCRQVLFAEPKSEQVRNCFNCSNILLLFVRNLYLSVVYIALSTEIGLGFSAL